MRKKIVAGNWKMNLGRSESEKLVQEISNSISWESNNCDRVIVAPAFVNLIPALELAARDGRIEVCAQNMHFEESGAFTGEVSPMMLKDIGVNTVIIGHSERRALFGETDELLYKKVEAGLQYDMEIIFCVGELLSDRQAENHFEVVRTQLKNTVLKLAKNSWSKIIIAYEPVWAIGTGETATPAQAQKMHQFIRSEVSRAYDTDLAGELSILYGGSVKPGNAAELFSQPDVDGALVGGASLDAASFVQIINAH